jgi:DnaJ-class molecular chaperone
MRDGDSITCEGVADEKPRMIPGDIHFIIIEMASDLFNRDGDRLYKTMEIPLVEALVRIILLWPSWYEVIHSCQLKK